MMNTFVSQAAAILDFYKGLNPTLKLPAGVSLMNPYANEHSWKLVETFYRKYYSDQAPRTFIFGINPGRFGGGVTGIPFTDPIRLKEACGIHNDLKRLPELSSQFIYQMIGEYGGPGEFYSDFFFSALSPLGFVREGKNLNYYDNKELIAACEPFMIQSISQQQDTMHYAATCYCLGEGENFGYFTRLNGKYNFFKEIIPLPHPRWIMQYRRKRLDEFVKQYVETFKAIHEK